MIRPRRPMAILPTHEVTNMPSYMGDQDLWNGDQALKEWTILFGAGWASSHLSRSGKLIGSAETFEKADDANRHPPELKAFDRYGRRINQVKFNSAYHHLMKLAISNQVHNFAWRQGQQGAHVAHSVLTYMFNQPEGGVNCAMAMHYAAPPAIGTTQVVANEWMPRVLSTEYDFRDIPASEKAGALIGMFMTEKQGGSDVRANSTSAVPLGMATGIGSDYLLTGHKYFCSMPMNDAFLVLAKTSEQEISCFLVPRWKPDGSRNELFLQRLKDKLGNRSNASVEIEFENTYGVMVGEEARGIATIMEMVTGNRLYCAMSSAGLMRQAAVQALYHVSHRNAFQKRLIQQPLMKNVLADLLVEVEAALALGLRIAHAFDNAGTNPGEAAFARIGTALAKYWNCKRAPAMVFEALECLGGLGFIEDSIMPRLYREAPLNSIWEGSGNIIGLDVLRAIKRQPETLSVLFKELDLGRGTDPNLDKAIDELHTEIENFEQLEGSMRIITERMAMTLQASLLTRFAPAPVARAFCTSRLGNRYSGAFGTLSPGCDLDSIIDRGMPLIS
ncbi:MAG: DNA alkylation response protein [Rhodospirillaceae bacterium]|nr:DNA alkylation response protein [Rhodospirillaceae bacterium]